ncbi:MAG TPA: hypothetical protein VGW77_33555 [Candidatus Binatia bacterium]|nr:hypothetical protein [Candidatus Binatia bacterium]
MNVKTDKETVSVHLGPSWYLENQDVKIDPKDKVEVKGSRITFGGKPAIIAAEVKKGDEVLKLAMTTASQCGAASGGARLAQLINNNLPVTIDRRRSLLFLTWSSPPISLTSSTTNSIV